MGEDVVQHVPRAAGLGRLVRGDELVTVQAHPVDDADDWEQRSLYNGRVQPVTGGFEEVPDRGHVLGHPVDVVLGEGALRAAVEQHARDAGCDGPQHRQRHVVPVRLRHRVAQQRHPRVQRLQQRGWQARLWAGAAQAVGALQEGPPQVVEHNHLRAAAKRQWAHPLQRVAGVRQQAGPGLRVGSPAP